MDKIHDMGGMHGFGAVDGEDAGAFHAAWERRVPGVRLAASLAGHGYSSVRPFIEALPAEAYVSSTYYERWALAIAALVAESGLVSAQDIAERARAILAGEIKSPAAAEPSRPVHDAVLTAFAGIANPPAAPPGRFQEGDRVRVRRMAPAGHTRCPRYARGVEGTIERVTGGFARPDAGEHVVEQTYTVRFALPDIWGEQAEEGVLYLDLWEGYLE